MVPTGLTERVAWPLRERLLSGNHGYSSGLDSSFSTQRSNNTCCYRRRLGIVAVVVVAVVDESSAFPGVGVTVECLQTTPRAKPRIPDSIHAGISAGEIGRATQPRTSRLSMSLSVVRGSKWASRCPLILRMWLELSNIITLYCVEKEQRITKCFISWWNRIQPLLLCIGTCTLDKGEHIHHPIKRISPFTSWNMFYT